MKSPSRSVKVTPIQRSVVTDQPGKPVSARCVLSGCQDFKESAVVTRFEVIDEQEHEGRVFVRRDCRVELSWQDGGRTLKVFVKEPDAT